MKVLVYAGNDAERSGDAEIVSDPLLKFLSNRGAELTVSHPGAGGVLDTGNRVVCDLADFRRLHGDEFAFLKSAAASAEAVLISPSIFSRIQVLEEIGQYLVRGPFLTFISHPAMYDPALLELRRHIDIRTLGILESGAFSMGISGIRTGEERSALLYCLDLAFGLFGLPSGPTKSRSVGKNGVSVWAYAVGTVEMGLEIRLSDPVSGAIGTGEPTVEGECRLLFSDGSAELSFGRSGRGFVMRERGGREWKAFTAEGPGEYYLALDIIEALGEGRCSGILNPEEYFTLRRTALKFSPE